MLRPSILLAAAAFVLPSTLQATPESFAHLADAACGPVNVDKSSLAFVDTCGRTRLFRGFNVVYKGAPWHPMVDAGAFDATQSFSDVDAALCQSLGASTIRLGWMWPGVEPALGQINATYVALMANATKMAAGFGISPLIDMHQDDVSGVFCGEGIPDWAARLYSAGAQAFPAPVDTPYVMNATTGEPNPSDCDKHPNWSDYYFSDALCKATQAMYTNANGSALRFYNFWQIAGSTFGRPDLSPSVLGYEIMNEPWPGDVLSNPLLLVPGIADSVNLQPFFTNATAALRAGERGAGGAPHVSFWETITWDDFLPAGFSALPNASDGLAALSYHYYDLPNFNVQWQLSARAADMARLRAGGLLTEFDFGAEGDFSETVATMAAAEAMRQGYIGWEYKSFWPITGVNNGFFNADGSVQTDKAAVFARTFPLAVAGDIAAFAFDNITRSFALNYSLNAAAAAPTVVFLSDALVYPSGYDIAAVSAPPGAVQWSVQHFNASSSGVQLPVGAPAPFDFSYLLVSSVTGAPHGAAVSVSVTPR